MALVDSVAVDHFAKETRMLGHSGREQCRLARLLSKPETSTDTHGELADG
ncbi:hypothetical protein [Tomitella cavernea]|uniref:Uncharacterized protein n=1 Tax=Tomitella cavernea TaxID=1387982 RepID=A0ABP9CMT9_9ACTN|nr:hypothetical protein [Tomitella cavernea]